MPRKQPDQLKIREALRLVGYDTANEMLCDNCDLTGQPLDEIDAMSLENLWHWHFDKPADLEQHLHHVRTARDALAAIPDDIWKRVEWKFNIECGWPLAEGRPKQKIPFIPPGQPLLRALELVDEELQDRKSSLKSREHPRKQAQKAVALRLAKYWVLSEGSMPEARASSSKKNESGRDLQPRHNWSIAVLIVLEEFGDATGWHDVCRDTLKTLKANGSAEFKRLLEIRKTLQKN